MLGAPEAVLPGLGGPRWGGSADWALGAGRHRAAVRPVASVPRWGVRSAGVTPPAGPPSGTTGALAAARPGEPGPESGGLVPGADEVVDGAVDLCPRGWRGADQQCSGARPAPGRAVAEGQFRVGQRSRQSVCGAAADGGSHLPAARTGVAGLPGG